MTADSPAHPQMQPACPPSPEPTAQNSALRCKETAAIAAKAVEPSPARVSRSYPPPYLSTCLQAPVHRPKSCLLVSACSQQIPPSSALRPLHCEPSQLHLPAGDDYLPAQCAACHSGSRPTTSSNPPSDPAAHESVHEPAPASAHPVLSSP